MTTRREILLAFGAGALTWQAPSFAQLQKQFWRIGFLSTSPATDQLLDTLREALRSRGYIEGKNLAIEYRANDENPDRLAASAAELASKVDLILAWATPAAIAAKQATATVPIVIVGVADPVGSGLVPRLAQPGGNITGNSNIVRDLSAKLVELLSQLVPGKTRLAVLCNVSNQSTDLTLKETEMAARRLSRPLQAVEIRNARELDSAFETIAKARPAGVVVLPDTIIITHRQRIADLALRHRIPTVFARAENADAGGLVSYGSNLNDQMQSVAGYIDRIFRGAKPGDLPIEQPTKIELVINLKTAKALGIKIPQSILVRADRVIE